MNMSSKLNLISGVHHVAIICSDYERSKKFYTELLGFPIVHEAYREDRRSWKLDLDAGGGVQIELFSFAAPPKRLTRPEACGLRHLSLRVEDIDSVIEHLAAQGVAVEPVRIDEFTGARFAFFADPDDLPIELYDSGD